MVGLCLNSFAARILAGAALTVVKGVEKFSIHADGVPLCGITGARFGFVSASGAYDWVQAAVSRRAAGNQSADGLVKYLDRVERARIKAGMRGDVDVADMLAAEVVAVQAVTGGAEFDGGGAASLRVLVVDGGCAAY